MIKYNFYITLYDKDTGEQKHNKELFITTFYETIKTQLNKECFSVYEGVGTFKRYGGRVVREPFLKFEIIMPEELAKIDLYLITNKICDKLNQNGVLITKARINIE